MQPSAAVKNLSTSWSAAFVTRLHRYKSLFLRRWWIPVLTICLGLFVEAFLIYQTPPSYQSTSKMMMAGKLNIAQGAVYSEDAVNFYGTQIQLMQRGSSTERGIACSLNPSRIAAGPGGHIRHPKTANLD